MADLLYPPDLVPIAKDRWQRLQSRLNAPALVEGGRKKAKPTTRLGPVFPSDGELTKLLGVAYHASLLREEARPLSVRLMYRGPSSDSADRMNLGEEPYRLAPPVPLSISNLVRLAPAVEVTESAICVAPGRELGQGQLDDLYIWGVAHLGPDWWQLITAQESAAILPPNFLTVTATAPGTLTVSAMGLVLVRLRNGGQLTTPLPNLDEGHVGEFLSRGAEALYRDVVSTLKLKRYHSREDSDNHPRNLYYRTIQRILHLVREQRHGGTLLIVPHEYAASASDSRLVDRLIPKYQVQTGIWPSLVDEAVANREYYRLLFPHRRGEMLYQSKKPSARSLLQLTQSEKSLDRARERIDSYARFVSGLANVDGAVLMTDRLALLGFGIEIIATSPSLAVVKQAQDPFAKDWSEASIYSFGTRHRSTMRMCSSLEDCVGIVVSQDGPIRAVKRVGPDLFTWSDIALGQETL